MRSFDALGRMVADARFVAGAYVFNQSPIVVRAAEPCMVRLAEWGCRNVKLKRGVECRGSKNDVFHLSQLDNAPFVARS